MPRVTFSGPPQKNRHAHDVAQQLHKLREKSEEEHAARLAHKTGLPYIDLHITPISSDDILTIPEETARSLHLAVIHRSGKKLRIVTPRPEDVRVKEFITMMDHEQDWDITLFVVSPSSLERALLQYNNTVFLDAIASMHIDLTGKDLEDFEAGLGRLLKLKDHINTLSTTETLNILFAGAIALGASDVHLEPEQHDVRLRYRVDGVLQEIIRIPYTIYKALLSRIKLMGQMKINIHDRSQDGHFSFTVNTSDVDVRVSTIPSRNAEGIVMRLLDSKGIAVSLDDLGIVGKAYIDVTKNITKNTGLILTTGPTGSGKTTTLYTIISHIKSEGAKIITIEDPIEYQLPDIVQTEVSLEYTFAKGLRSIVRQDPDILLVGEIRDEETANISINAALTGHLIFSTLHTNNAVATIARLLELGVRPSLIPPATNIFIAQRLVRTLCSCKEAYEPAEETKELLMHLVALISPKAHMKIPTAITTLYRPKGCVLCHGTGYKGRIGIFEVLTMSETIENLILNLAGETEIMKAALEEGFVTMTQDGVLKSLSGVTSMEEVWRVTSEGDTIEKLYDDLMSQTLARKLFIAHSTQKFVQSAAQSPAAINDVLMQAEDDDVLALLFAYAFTLRASDIHIEPQQETVTIRVRIDSVLQTIATLPLASYPLLLGKIKNLATIPTTVRQSVSDSRFSILREHTDGEEEKSDVRVSIILGGFGETAVMRILDRAAIKLDIRTLGFHAYNMERIMREARKPHGMILNTGPTGSGKTTTLYSVLQELNTPSVKIITIEDPIEYQLDGILQTQINKVDDYTFANALRSLLRQDPDILLVGEIRDEETAEIAINASLTGHLMISTLHTNNAVGAIQRLQNLGARLDDLTTSLNAIIAQRLVRTLCSCKKAVAPTPEQLTLIKKTLSLLTQNTTLDLPSMETLYEPEGCEACNGLGYKGQSVVSEVLVMDSTLRGLIAHGALASELADAAQTGGMLTMEQDAILKVLAGETTLAEAQRVTML